MQQRIASAASKHLSNLRDGLQRYQDWLYLRVEDDGRGSNRETLVARAKERGAKVGPESALLELLSMRGISSSDAAGGIACIKVVLRSIERLLGGLTQTSAVVRDRKFDVAPSLGELGQVDDSKAEFSEGAFGAQTSLMGCAGCGQQGAAAVAASWITWSIPGLGSNSKVL